MCREHRGEGAGEIFVALAAFDIEHGHLHVGFRAFSLHFLFGHFLFFFARGIDGFPADRKWNGILSLPWRSLEDEKSDKG